MKQTIFGILAAVLFVGTLWFGLRLLPPVVSGQGSGGAAAVAAGFVGHKQFGPWLLNCPPAKANTPANATAPAFSLTPGHGSPLPPPPGTQTGASASDENSLGRCRTILPYFSKADRKQLIMVVSFRTLGKTGTLAMVVRFPVLAKKGDDLVVKSGGRGFKLPVYQCQSGVCVAAGQLGAAVEKLLFSSPEAVLVFPAGADGKRRAARVPLKGVPTAIANMRKAES